MSSKSEIAIHEAGHAVAAALLGLRIHEASIATDNDSIGNVTYWLRDDPNTKRADAAAGIAGPIAEALYLGGFERGGDAVEAFARGHRLVTTNPAEDAEAWISLPNRKDEIVRAVVDALAGCWDAVLEVAGELECRKTLRGRDIARILR